MNSKQLTLGIRPQTKMFRLSTNWGEIVDHIFSSRGKKGIPIDYYVGIKRIEAADQTIILSEKSGNELKLSPSDIILTKSVHNSERHLNIKNTIEEFCNVVSTLNEVLKFKGIRRIGIVSEYRLPSKAPSHELMTKLTRISPFEFPGKFNLSIESRKPTLERVSLDIEKDDFFNTIWQFYDSILDKDKEEQNSYNCNIDVQRYFAPLIDGDIVPEIKKLHRTFQGENEAFIKYIKDKVCGVKNGQKD